LAPKNFKLKNYLVEERELELDEGEEEEVKEEGEEFGGFGGGGEEGIAILLERGCLSGGGVARISDFLGIVLGAGDEGFGGGSDNKEDDGEAGCCIADKDGGGG